MIRAIRGLARIDAKSVARDPLLRWMVVLPLLMAVVLRYLVPVVTVKLQNQYGFALEPYYALITSFVTLIGPQLSGVIIGFLLLDQRDDGTLTALQVTPLSLNGFLVYRLAVLTALSTLMSLVSVPLVDLVEIKASGVFLVSIVAAPLAPFYALLLACFASNKVQGFALMKAAGILSWPPIIAYFLPTFWQWILGIVPQLWPVKIFWMLEAGDTGILPYVVSGLTYQFFLVALLLRRFHRILRR